MAEALVNVQVVSRHIDKDPVWIYNNAERLGIPRYRVGRHLRFRLSEVDAWVSSLAEGSAA